MPGLLGTKQSKGLLGTPKSKGLLGNSQPSIVKKEKQPKEKSFINKVSDFLLGTPKPLQAAINADNKGASLVKGFTDSTTLGLTEDETSRKLAQKHPLNYNAGKMLGYVTPGGLISKGIEKATAKTIGTAAKEVGKRVAVSSLTGGALTGAENSVAQTKRAVKGEQLKPTGDILKEVGINTAAGGLLDLGLMGLGKVGSKLGESAFKNTVEESKLGLKTSKLKGYTPKGLETKKINELNKYYDDIAKSENNLLSNPDYVRAENAARAKQGLKPLAEVKTSIVTRKSRLPYDAIETSDPIVPLKKEPSVIVKKTPTQKSVFFNELVSKTDHVVNPIKNEPITQPIAPKIENNILKPTTSVAKDMSNNINSVLPDTKSHIVTKTTATKPSVPHILNKGYIKTFDDLSRLNDFDKAIETTTNKPLSADKKSYVLGLNSRGNDMISKQILTQDLVDSKGNVVGPSLKSTTKLIPKGQEKDFEDYLINKHAITRMSRGEKVFPDDMQMTPEKSQAIVNNYDATHPHFKELAQKVYDYNNNLAKSWLVDTGIISPQEWEGYLKANPNYVPMNRLFSDLEKPSFTSGKKGFASQTNPVKSAPGSQRKIISPIESIIEHTGQYVKTAKRNEVMQSIIENLKNNPDELSGWAELVDTPNEKITELLHSEGPEGVLKQLNDTFENATKKPDLSKGNIVTGIVNGEKVHVKVNDPEMLNALTNLSPQGQNIVIQGIGKVTKVMKLLTTGINPVFSLTRNVFRDIPTAYINSKTTNNPVTFAKDLVDSFVSVIGNKELYKSYKAIGGGHASSISSDRNALLEAKNEILKSGPSLKKGFQKGLSALERLNDAVETAPRLGEFKRASKGGDYASKVKGLYEANDVTVNFNKRGQWGKEVDQVIPYFNAALQGIDKTVRTFKDNPVQASAKAFASISIPSIILFAINHDNPDYQKVSNYVKDSNFLIPKGDGTFIKIPKPRELGVAFGSDVERELRSWKDKDPKAWEDFVTTIKDNFAPPTRTTLHPAIVDLTANKNYANNPIVPQDMFNDKRSPKYQYDSKTSEVSKFIGDKLNVSPMKLDYLAKSYGGGLAELALPLTTKGGNLGQTLKQKVTVDPVFSNDILRNFYDNKTKLETSKTDNKLNGIKNNNLDILKLKKYDKVADRISDTRKLMKKIQNDNTIESKDKLLKLRDLQQKINDLANSIK